MASIVEEPIDLSLHPGGIDTVTKETSLKEGFLRDSVNFDISSDGKKKVRPGYVKKYSGTNVHSISPESVTVGKYFMEGGTLKKLRGDYTAATIVSNLSPIKTHKMHYVQIDDKVYYSNGFNSGMIKNDVNYSWGVAEPTSAPTLTEVSGVLNGGIYGLKFTNIRDGEESGATNYATLTVDDGAGIQITNIPQASDCDYVRIYSTKRDGEVFYKQVDVPMGVTTWNLFDVIDGNELQTDNMYNNPVGHIIEKYKGRIYIARDNKLYWTEPLRYGLYHYDNYIKFPERITVLISVDDGIYVVSDRTYYLAGNDPSDFKMQGVYGEKAVEGTQYKLTHNYFNIDDYYGDVAVWVSTKGLVRGQNNGNITPLTEKRYALDEYNDGATGFYEQDGIRKLVSTLTNKGGSSNFRASDKVVATVTRANEVT